MGFLEKGLFVCCNCLARVYLCVYFAAIVLLLWIAFTSSYPYNCFQTFELWPVKGRLCELPKNTFQLSSLLLLVKCLIKSVNIKLDKDNDNCVIDV